MNRTLRHASHHSNCSETVNGGTYVEWTFTFCLIGVGIPIANIYFWAWVFSLKVAAVTSCGACLTFIECSSFCL